MTGGYLPLVSTLNAARVTDWMAGLLGVDHEQLAAMALAADPGAAETFAAFLDGERKPDRPRASGLLAGLTSSTTREALARAAYGGVLLGLLNGESSINSCGVPTDGQLLVAGGGSRSPAYRQLLADLAGRPVAVADADEATARGAALQAAAVASATPIEQVRRAWAPARTVVAEPRPGTGELRAAVTERYVTAARWTGFDGLAHGRQP